MHLSHSGLQQLLTCPASYFLTKHAGLSLKKESTALQVGSAFHWGVEHGTEDLHEYLDELDPMQTQYNDFTKEVALAEGMLHGYFKQRDKLYSQILKDYDDGTPLTLISEEHELDLLCELPSLKFDQPHEFHGIIDLLILTDKGFIILDYKTSSQKPDWDKYLDQILRYCWMVNQKFPEVPIYKIGIINARKTGLKLKANENAENFAMRIRREYDFDDCDLINYHEFTPANFEKSKLDIYITNLSRMADFAQMIQDTQSWYINYANAVSVYGKSEFWDLFYKTKDCKYLYKVFDPMYDPELCETVKYRDATDLDINCLEVPNPLNSYAKFKAFVVDTNPNEDLEVWRKSVFDQCRKNFTVDEKLLVKYWNEFIRELTEDIQNA